MINTLSASTCELVDEYSNSPVSDVQAENFYFQVKFIKCYLREIISFTKKLTLETGASLAKGLRLIFRGKYTFVIYFCVICKIFLDTTVYIFIDYCVCIAYTADL